MTIVKVINPNQQASVTGISFRQNILEQAAAAREEKIAIMAQYQTGKTVTDYVPEQVFDAESVGDKYGYGSPLHLAAQKMFPANGDNAIVPVNILPIPDPGTSTAGTGTITVTGAATGNFTFFIVYNEQNVEAAASACKQITNNAQVNPAKPPRGLEFDGYNQNAIAVTVLSGQSATEIGDAIVAAITDAVEAPFTAANAAGVVTLTMKWKGADSAAVFTAVDANGDAITTQDGVTLALVAISGGAGVVDLEDALAQLTEEFKATRVVNQFEADSNLDDIQAWGEALRVPTISQIALCYTGKLYIEDGSTGNVDVDAMVAFGDGRRDDAINVVIPGTFDLTFPNLTARDTMLKAGIANVIPVGGGVSGYKLQDVFTLYHPTNPQSGLGDWQKEDTVATKVAQIANDQILVFREGEQYRAVVLIADEDSSENPAARKKSDFKATLDARIDEYVKNSWVTNPAYAKASSTVEYDDVNPNRVNINNRFFIPGSGRVYDIVNFFAVGTGQ